MMKKLQSKSWYPYAVALCIGVVLPAVGQTCLCNYVYCDYSGSAGRGWLYHQA